MLDINDSTNPMAAALRDFGVASGNLLAQWLKALPPDQLHAIDGLLGQGAQLGIRFLAATNSRRPMLVVLMSDPAGDFYPLAEVCFERDTLQ